MRKLIIVALLLGLCILPAKGMELAEQWNTDSLRDELSGEAAQWMREYDPSEATELLSGVGDILQKGLDQSGFLIKNALQTLVRLLLIVVFSKLGETILEAKQQSVSTLTGALAIAASCVGDLHSMVQLGKQTMNELSSFSTALLPVMASAAAASGSANQAGVIYSLTVLFSNALLQIANAWIIPVIYAYLALSLADTILCQERLKRLRDLLGWGAKTLLKGFLSIFTGFLTVSGVLSGPADAAARKAARAAISSFVPVVGGIISGAADTLLSGAAVLKAAVGSFGMLAIFAMFLLPFLRLGVWYLTAKLTAALAAMAESGLSRLLEGVATSMGFLLALVAGSAFLDLLACCCLVRTVNG